MAIWRDAKSEAAKGILVVYVRESRQQPSGSYARAEFSLPLGAYLQAVNRIDALADGYRGSPKMCLDGTGFAFERTKTGKPITGGGNVCIDHYREISAIFLDIAKRFGTSGFGELGPYWMPELKPPR